MQKAIAIAAAILLSAFVSAQEQPRPADKDKMYLTIITHPDWESRPDEKRLVEAVKTQPMLKVAQECHFKHILISDDMYKSRWANLYPADRLPAIIFQEPGGGYYFKGSAENVPVGSQAIFDTLRAYKNMTPEERNVAFEAMEYASEKSILYEPEDIAESDDILSRRRPPRDLAPPDSFELFGGKTPVRDSLSSAAMIFLSIVATGLVICLGLIALIAFFVTLKYWK